MSTNGVVQLSAADPAPGHPFADPVHTADDLSAITVMASALRMLLAGDIPDSPRPLMLDAPESEGRGHRVAMLNAHALRVPRDLAFVGFFGKKRPGIDPGPLNAIDDELIQELPAHPGILSYSSLELADGNWANLIMTDPPEAKDHWRISEKHAWAARELAPRVYTVVRLHNGRFPGGLVSGRAPILIRTMYYDYQGAEPWLAQRELPQF